MKRYDSYKDSEIKWIDEIPFNWKKSRIRMVGDLYGGLTGKQTQKLKNASIGVKFHKFKMNRNYNIPEIDDVVLKDYCSNTYLDKNFISILNGIWSQSGVNFFLRDMIDENEHTNLATYYNYSPDDNIIYPNCEDIVNFKNNPVTPGVILTETMAQIGLVAFGIYLLSESSNTLNDVKIALTSSEVDFFIPVFPGEKVTVKSEKEYFRFNKLKCKVEMFNQKGELVCRGKIAGMIQ